MCWESDKKHIRIVENCDCMTIFTGSGQIVNFQALDSIIGDVRGNRTFVSF